jgi:hypothetical protein
VLLVENWRNNPPPPAIGDSPSPPRWRGGQKANANCHFWGSDELGWRDPKVDANHHFLDFSTLGFDARGDRVGGWPLEMPAVTPSLRIRTFFGDFADWH